jgi:phospholipase/lecithinase/hemolysin
MHPRTLARRLLAMATVVVAAAATPVAASAQFSSITFLGDSFTDTGNGDILSMMLLGIDLTPSPPYAPGVASNGPVWANYFAAALGRAGDAGPSALGGRNFAVGTARTGITGTGGLSIGMLSQLAQTPAVADPSGLYVLFGGANDIADAAGLLTPAAQLAALVTAADNLAFSTTQLYARGARSFLVASVPNVGRTPQALLNPDAAPLLAGLTTQFNTLLATRLTALDALAGSTVVNLRLDNLFDAILADAATGGSVYGLTNPTQPCLPPPFGLGTASCAVSVFADGQHPTTAAHRLIANAAVQSVVPEPATVVLFASGLVLLSTVGVARRRR